MIYSFALLQRSESNNSKIVQSQREALFLKEEETFAERRRQYKKQCQEGVSGSVIADIDYHAQSKLAVCRVPKVGSTCR